MIKTETDNYKDKYRQLQKHTHLENTFKERSSRIVTFETFDQSDEEKQPDERPKAKTNAKTNAKT